VDGCGSLGAVENPRRRVIERRQLEQDTWWGVAGGATRSHQLIADPLSATVVTGALRSVRAPKEPRRILAVLDTHERSHDVRELAFALSKKHGAQLTFTTIVPCCFPWAAGAGIGLPLPSVEELDDEAERVLASALQDIPYGLNVEAVVDRGFGLEALLRRIDLGAHDLVILRRTVTSLLLRYRTASKVIEVRSRSVRT
jgi:nucleotide-binding universal stress UspA family protein